MVKTFQDESPGGRLMSGLKGVLPIKVAIEVSYFE